MKKVCYTWVSNHANQTLANSTQAKAVYPTVQSDADGCWDAVNNRYIPTGGPGTFLVTTGIYFLVSAAALILMGFSKNGTEILRPYQTNIPGQGMYSATAVVNLNGSTDYIEVLVEQVSGASATLGVAQDLLFYFIANRLS